MCSRSRSTAGRSATCGAHASHHSHIPLIATRGSRQAPIPFCDTVCYYCACNKIVTKNRDKAATYLGYLKREIEMQGRLFAGINAVEQLHFGGGTPTYLSDQQMDDLMAHLRRACRFAPDGVGEYSIEVDPRTVSAARVHGLRRQGFNRVSLGVQDFDANVQTAVHRIQPEAETREASRPAEALFAQRRAVRSDPRRPGWPRPRHVRPFARWRARRRPAGPRPLASPPAARLP
jgi:coproporphyrinogen III oxidase-like Fe-S oxidoreductase